MIVSGLTLIHQGRLVSSCAPPLADGALPSPAPPRPSPAILAALKIGISNLPSEQTSPEALRALGL
jgi:hypothetical protein